MNIAAECNEMLTDLNDKIKTVDKELSGLPKGRLTQEKHHGKPALVAVSNLDGKRHRRTLAIDNPETFALVRRRVLERQLEELKHNQELIDAAARNLRETSNYNQLQALVAKFPCIPESELIKAITPGSAQLEITNSMLADWAKQPFEQLSYMAEQKRQVTSRGLYVRSKSELLIAEILYEYGIIFRYEQVLHFGNITLAPDFTIMRPDSKIFYWEHQGLTNSRDYVERQIKKLQMYISNGITPWDNLILSYDNNQGTIDTRIIRAEIENKLLEA